jgi:hypothetical protein
VFVQSRTCNVIQTSITHQPVNATQPHDNEFVRKTSQLNSLMERHTSHTNLQVVMNEGVLFRVSSKGIMSDGLLVI